MARHLLIAVSCAAVLFVGCFVLLWRGPQAPPDTAGGPPQAESASGRQGDDSSSGTARTGGSARGGGLSGTDGADGSVRLEAELDDLSRRELRRRRLLGMDSSDATGRRGDGRATDGTVPGSGGGDGSRDGGKATDGILRGGQLSAAVREALDLEDLGALQGLLISGLTKDGTRFGPEDVSALFDALLNVDDYGMEKLVLTHLERLEAPPEDLARGYADYLTSSRNPQHAEEAFGQLVRIGGDASFDALSGMVDTVESPRLARRAVEALGELGDPRAVPILRQQLYSTSDPAETRSYTTALAKLGSAEAVSSLVDYVSREGRESSLMALREIREKSAAPVLSASLSDRSVTSAYQRAALSSLRTLQEPESLQGLDRFLGKAEGSVLRDTIETIGRIPDPQAARILESFAARQEDARVATQAQRAAQRLRTRLEYEAQRAAEQRDAKAARG